MSVLVAYSTPGVTVSGRTYRTGDETFATIRAGAGTGSSYDTGGVPVILEGSATSNQYDFLGRGFFLFTTSSLTAGATISAAVVSLYSSFKYTGLGAFEMDVVASTPASNTVLANSDHGNIGSTPFSSVASASLSASAYNDFTLDAGGISAIDKVGISKYGARINWDTDNSFGGTWSSGQVSGMTFLTGGEVGTTTDPKITVTYTTAVGPAGVKTYNALASASTKTINELAIASIKSYNGIT